MSIRRLLFAGVLGAGMLMVAAPAKAQEFSVGYNYLHIHEEDADEIRNIPAGWYADVTGHITPMVGLVGQVTGNYKSIDFGGGVDGKAKIHSFMGGLRAGSGASKVRPFGQVLFGAVNSKFSASGFSESDNDAAIQVGAGVNVMSGGAVGVRLGADYLRVFTDDEGVNVFRLALGLVFGK